MPLITGGRFVVGAVTVIENAGSDALAWPSLTLITMFENVPVVPDGGVPDSCPVPALNAAHAGRPAMLHVSGSPSASLAVGTNVYEVPAATDVIGVPEITGGWLVVGGVTTMLKAGSATAVALPSLTLMTMPANVPTFATCGTPVSWPVVAEKDAQDGLLAIVNESVSPSTSLAVGVNV